MEIVKKVEFEGKIPVWFFIDNIRLYDENQKLIEKDDQYFCFFNLSKPTPFIFGELVRDGLGRMVISKTFADSLNNAKEYVMNKFGFRI